MDVILDAWVEYLINGQRRIASDVGIAGELPVKPSQGCLQEPESNDYAIGLYGLEYHGLHQFVSHDSIPVWHIVIELPIQVFGDEVRSMLSHVGVHEQKKETSIEELGQEDTIDNGCKLLGRSFLPDPLDQVPDSMLQHKVDAYNHETYGLTEDEGNEDIIIKDLADRFCI